MLCYGASVSASGATSTSISFAASMPTAAYQVFLTPSWLTTARIAAKSTTGFSIEFGATATSTAPTFDWLASA